MWKFKSVSITFDNLKKVDLIKYGYPYIVTMGITSLFQALDQLSLNYFCSYREVGIYASTMTLVHVFNIVQTTFNTLWAPMSVEHYTNDKHDRSFFQKGNKIITVIMFFMGFSLILVKDVFAILLGEKYREAAMILPFLIFNPIMYTVSETTVSGLVFMKKSKMQVLVAVGACLTNAIGNYILVPVLGCKGAAISTGISYIVFFALRTFFSNKYFYVDFGLKKFSILTVLAVLYALYNTFVKFNYLCIVLYVVIMIIMFILYKDTIIWGVKYLIDILKDKISRRSLQ
jgi:O-antigen/teichoic acid export membrane protein